jgi:hypothetical protein
MPLTGHFRHDSAHKIHNFSGSCAKGPANGSTHAFDFLRSKIQPGRPEAASCPDFRRIFDDSQRCATACEPIKACLDSRWTARFNANSIACRQTRSGISKLLFECVCPMAPTKKTNPAAFDDILAGLEGGTPDRVSPGPASGGRASFDRVPADRASKPAAGIDVSWIETAQARARAKQMAHQAAAAAATTEKTGEPEGPARTGEPDQTDDSVHPPRRNFAGAPSGSRGASAQPPSSAQQSGAEDAPVAPAADAAPMRRRRRGTPERRRPRPRPDLIRSMPCGDCSASCLGDGGVLKPSRRESGKRPRRPKRRRALSPRRPARQKARMRRSPGNSACGQTSPSSNSAASGANSPRKIILIASSRRCGSTPRGA